MMPKPCMMTALVPYGCCPIATMISSSSGEMVLATTLQEVLQDKSGFPGCRLICGFDTGVDRDGLGLVCTSQCVTIIDRKSKQLWLRNWA